MSMMNLPATVEVARTINPMNGCKLVEMEMDELKLGGVSPKPDVPSTDAGLLEFNTEGDVTNPGTDPPPADVVVGDGVVAVNGDGVVVVSGDGVVVCDDDVGYTHVPVLGLVVVIVALPPKSQLVWTGFF